MREGAAAVTYALDARLSEHQLALELKPKPPASPRSPSRPQPQRRHWRVQAAKAKLEVLRGPFNAYKNQAQALDRTRTRQADHAALKHLTKSS